MIICFFLLNSLDFLLNIMSNFNYLDLFIIHLLNKLTVNIFKWYFQKEIQMQAIFNFFFQLNFLYFSLNIIYN